jgi:hypothetical protein
MNVSEVMTRQVVIASPGDTLQKAAARWPSWTRACCRWARATVWSG